MDIGLEAAAFRSKSHTQLPSQPQHMCTRQAASAKRKRSGAAAGSNTDQEEEEAAAKRVRSFLEEFSALQGFGAAGETCGEALAAAQQLLAKLEADAAHNPALATLLQAC